MTTEKICNKKDFFHFHIHELQFESKANVLSVCQLFSFLEQSRQKILLKTLKLAEFSEKYSAFTEKLLLGSAFT